MNSISQNHWFNITCSTSVTVMNLRQVLITHIRNLTPLQNKNIPISEHDRKPGANLNPELRFMNVCHYTKCHPNAKPIITFPQYAPLSQLQTYYQQLNKTPQYGPLTQMQPNASYIYDSWIRAIDPDIRTYWPRSQNLMTQIAEPNDPDCRT